MIETEVLPNSKPSRFETNEGVFHYLDGKLHREDGPAIEFKDGHKIWYLHEKPHRIDGPAVEGLNGINEWWINGVKFTENEFNSIILANNLNNELADKPVTRKIKI